MRTYIAAIVASVAFARQLNADYDDCHSCNYNSYNSYQPRYQPYVPVAQQPHYQSAWNSAFDEKDECTTCDDALDCYDQDCECAHEANTNSAFNRSFQKFSCNYKFESKPKTYTEKWAQPAYSFQSAYVRPQANIAAAVDPRISARTIADIPEVNKRVVTDTVPVYPNKDRPHFEEKYEAPCMEAYKPSYYQPVYQPYQPVYQPSCSYKQPSYRRGLAPAYQAYQPYVPVEEQPHYQSAWNSAFDEKDECTTCDDALDCYDQDCECAHEANTNSAFNRSFQKFSCNYKFESKPKTYTERWSQPAYSFQSRYVRPQANIAAAVDPRISARTIADIPEVNKRVVTDTVPVYENKDRPHFEEKYEAPCMEAYKPSYYQPVYQPYQPVYQPYQPAYNYGDCKSCAY